MKWGDKIDEHTFLSSLIMWNCWKKNKMKINNIATNEEFDKACKVGDYHQISLNHFLKIKPYNVSYQKLNQTDLNKTYSNQIDIDIVKNIMKSNNISPIVMIKINNYYVLLDGMHRILSVKFSNITYLKILVIHSKELINLMKIKIGVKYMDSYWKKRINFKYYKKVEKIVNELIKDKKVNSIIEVGGRDGYFLTRFNVNERVALDLSELALSERYPEVTKIHMDFMKYQPTKKYDLVICSQVLEHIPDEIVEKFAQKLFETAKYVIISVPYKWRKGFCKSHCQDPVDEKKLRSWTHRKPDRKIIAKDKSERLIAFYKN